MAVSYRKEEYTFLGDRIIYRGGGIFSDNKTELVIKNITHIESRLPFIENKLFGTGNVRIESAGSGVSEIVLKSVAKPLGYYKYMEDILKHNGFGLDKSNLIRKDKPSLIGVLLEVFFINNVGALFPFFIGLFIMGSSLPSLLFQSGGISKTALISGLLVFLLIGLISIVRFLDLKKRVYEIYDDVIVYTEGFLTKNYSFMPIENLSDSSLEQHLIEKIFGIYDVKISCQGSGQEIHFRNISDGPGMEKDIDSLIQGSSHIKEKVVLEKTKAVPIREEKKVSVKKVFNKDYTCNLKINLKKNLFIPLILFLPLIVVTFFLGFDAIQFWLFWVFFFGYFLIEALATKFIVKGQSIEKKFNFLNRKNLEFSCDKIMGVNIKESFVDKWFGTITIIFWSIGSGENIVFKNVNKNNELIKNLVSKVGITNKEIIHEMNSDWSFLRMLKAGVFSFIFVLVIIASSVVLALMFSPYFGLIAGAIVLFYLVEIFYSPIHYRRSKLKFYSDYVYFEKGVFFRNYYYSLFDNIKDYSTLKYIASDYGNIKFNVAGESIAGNNQNKTIVSNAFTINYIDGIPLNNNLIDIIFDSRPSRDKVLEMEKEIEKYSFKDVVISKPDVGPSVFGLVALSVIFFPLILLLPITLPILIWYIKVKGYYLQDSRVVSKWGIFYKKQLSVLHSKIDHVNSDEGFLNKIFHNGNISVNTTGSSVSELDVKDISDYKEFYKKLREHIR